MRRRKYKPPLDHCHVCWARRQCFWAIIIFGLILGLAADDKASFVASALMLVGAMGFGLAVQLKFENHRCEED